MSTTPQKRLGLFNEIHVKALYDAYPRHIGRADAFLAIRKALTKESYDVLLEAVEAYREASKRQPDRTLIPYPARWFNREQWLDDREEWFPQKNGKTPYSPASDAYDALCCEVRRVGSQQVPSYPDQASRAAVKAIGGWATFCSWETAMLGVRRKVFLEHYGR